MERGRIERGTTTIKAIRVLIHLAEHRFGSDVYELSGITGVGVRQTWRILRALHDAGIPLIGPKWGYRPRGMGKVPRNIRLVDRLRAQRLCGIR